MNLPGASYGLKHQVLSPVETIAQSVSSIAPTAAPTLVIPLVFGLSGQGTWLAYLIAMFGVLLVAANINVFARRSASPGSLYQYVSSSLGIVPGVIAGWAMLAAYIGTAAAVTGGLTTYANGLLEIAFGMKISPVLLTVLAVLGAWWLAYRNVQLSARTMLYLEAGSLTLIAFLFAVILAHRGFHADTDQLLLKGVTGDKLRLGLVLATFSFVGFESATALGGEARNPLRTIPRAVALTPVLSGILFVVAAYVEVLGFRGIKETLDSSTAPLQILAEGAGLAGFGVLISSVALVSFFACTLACITAAARILLLMGRHGILHVRLGQVHQTNQTPHHAVSVSALLTLIPVAILTLRGAPGLEINGWIGTFATYGFITAYLLVSIAAPLALRRSGILGLKNIVLSAGAIAFMAVALVGSFYPVPPAPYNWIPYAYLACLLAGAVWLGVLWRTRPGLIEEFGKDRELTGAES